MNFQFDKTKSSYKTIDGKCRFKARVKVKICFNCDKFGHVEIGCSRKNYRRIEEERDETNVATGLVMTRVRFI